MQAHSTAVISYRHPVPHFAPASLYPTHRGSRCASKPLTGTSFTIDALLAKPEDAGGNRASLSQCSVKYPPAVAHVLPFVRHVGLPVVPAPYVYPTEALQTSLHAQTGYSLHCPPCSYPESCRGAYYSQASMSKVNAALQSLKAKSGKSKRMRTSFTSEQLSRLEKEFARQQYMVGSERFLLASALQLTEAQVKVWFQNRRIKWRKQSLEQQQAKLAKLGLLAPPKSPGSQSHGDEDDVEEEFSDWDVDVDVNVSDDLAC